MMMVMGASIPTSNSHEVVGGRGGFSTASVEYRRLGESDELENIVLDDQGMHRINCN